MPRKAPTVKPLPKFGVQGRLGTKGTASRASTAVRAVLTHNDDGAAVVRVLWSERGRRRKETRPDTEANRAWARAFAEGVHDELRKRADGAPAAPEYPLLTLRALWDLYLVAFPDLRGRTVTNYTERWRKLEHFAGRDKLAGEVTRETMDQFVVALRKQHEPYQARQIVKTAVRVIRWGVERDLLRATKVAMYRMRLARGEGARKIPEYSKDEAGRILAQFDPQTPLGWKPYVATYLFALAGGRQNAVRHFRWDDVMLGTPVWTPNGPTFPGTTLRYQPALDKMGDRGEDGRGRVQPVPSGVAEALYVALGWRQAYGYTGPYILFRPALGRGTFDARTGRVYQTTRGRAAAADEAADQPYSYSAYNRRLHTAESAARPRVARVPYRAAHGFRRLVLNNALEATGGNLAQAAQYIGDRDLATVARSYARVREDQMRAVAEALPDPMAGRAGRGNRTATAPAQDAERPTGGPGAVTPSADETSE